MALPMGLAAQHVKDIRHPAYIEDVRHVAQMHRVLRQHAGRQDGQGGILRAVHPQRAFQPLSAVNHQRFHTLHLHRDGTAYEIHGNLFLMI